MGACRLSTQRCLRCAASRQAASVHGRTGLREEVEAFEPCVRLWVLVVAVSCPGARSEQPPGCVERVRQATPAVREARARGRAGVWHSSSATVACRVRSVRGANPALQRALPRASAWPRGTFAMLVEPRARPFTRPGPDARATTRRQDARAKRPMHDPLSARGPSDCPRACSTCVPPSSCSRCGAEHSCADHSEAAAGDCGRGAQAGPHHCSHAPAGLPLTSRVSSSWLPAWAAACVLFLKAVLQSLTAARSCQLLSRGSRHPQLLLLAGLLLPSALAASHLGSSAAADTSDLLSHLKQVRSMTCVSKPFSRSQPVSRHFTASCTA